MKRHSGGYGREHVLRVAEAICDAQKTTLPSIGWDKAQAIAGTALSHAVAMGLIPRGPEGDSYDARQRRRDRWAALAIVVIVLVVGFFLGRAS